jgi:hypothetical protein
MMPASVDKNLSKHNYKGNENTFSAHLNRENIDEFELQQAKLITRRTERSNRSFLHKQVFTDLRTPNYSSVSQIFS